MSATDHGVTIRPALRLENGAAQAEDARLVREEVLTLEVERVGRFALMWTPTGPRDRAAAVTAEDGLLGAADTIEPLTLAVGFLFSEGIIDGPGELASAALCPDDPGTIMVRLADPDRARVRRRDVLVASSCAVCGEDGGIDGLLATLPVPGDGLTVAPDTLHHLMAEMRAAQAVFAATGGSHAAALFDSAGRIVAMAEDLGRHNALDKVIGAALLAGIDTGACGAVLSSRLSLEMVTKAVRARLQIVAAVSAPTSLAVEIAERAGLTLCGFVRAPRLTIYSGRQRIAGAQSL